MTGRLSALRVPFEAGRNEPFGRWDWLLLAGVLVLAALLRLPGLEVTPPGLWRDEAGYALAAQDIQTGHLQVYWGDKEPLYPYVLAAVFTLVGPSIEALRATAALFGVATAGLTFLLGRLWFGRWGGLVAALALTMSFWTLGLNRIGFRVNTMPLVITLSFWLLWRALGAGGRGNWLAAGVVLGLTPYTYLAARMAPLVIVAFVLWSLAFDRARLAADRAGWAIFGGAAAATALPLLVFFALNPSYFADRASQLSPFGSANSPVEAAGLALGGARDTAGMFLIRGDSEPRHNLPGRPVMDPVTGVLFLIGLGAAVLRLRDRVAVFLLCWLVLLLLPSALARDNPHYLRTLGAAPAVFLLVGLGASTAGVMFGRVRVLAPAAASVWLALAGGLTAHDYFVVWARDPLTARFFEAEVTAAARLLRDTPPGPITYFSAPFVPHPTAQFLAPGRDPTWFDGAEGIVITRQAGPTGTVYALPGSNERTARLLADAYPGATVQDGPAGFDGEPLAWLVSIPPGAPGRPLALDRTVGYSIGGSVDLVGLSVPPTEIRPGSTFDVAIAWIPRGPTDQPDLAFFVHLLDAEGRPRGQHDAIAYPSFEWRGGEQVVSWFPLSVAQDAPPGRYQIVAGVYPRSTLQRLPVSLAGPSGDRAIGDQLEVGVTRIAPPAPGPPERPLGIELGSRVVLDGFDAPKNGCALEAARPPCELAIGLHWRALAAPAEDLQVFLHLAGPDGQPVAQSDGAPLNGAYPTSLWAAGERVLDRRVLALPAGLPAGPYRLLAGMYRLSDGSRLRSPTGADSVELGVLSVSP
ncbi:MAG: glycosyltransferase family 39 protein [Dehalococcoidia bacterium]